MEISKNVNSFFDYVTSTMGPGGKYVAVYDGFKPHITKDGVTVAKSWAGETTEDKVIIDIIKEAALKVADKVGDGPQPLTAKVLTPTGYVAMGDLKVGDEVCGTQGTTQIIEGVYPKGEKELHLVYFEDGSIVECCNDHLWTVTNSRGEVITMPLKCLMLSDITEFSVQPTFVEFKPREVGKSPLTLGLELKQDTEFIPEEYLYNTKEIRAALLSGLTSSIGELAGSNTVFHTERLTMRKQIAFLIRSLGGNAEITPKGVKKNDKTSNRIIKVVNTNKKVLMQCIKVSNPDNLYITDDCVVTHNTTTSIAFVNKYLETFNNKEFTLEDLKQFTEEAIKVIKENTVYPDDKMLKDTLKVSVNGDLEMTELLSSVIDKVGPEGTIKISKSLNGTDYVNYSNGLEFPTGMVSKYFVNDTKRRLFSSKECQVIVCNDSLDSFAKLEAVLTDADNKQAVLILCNDITENNIYTLVSSLDNFPGGICVCKMPSFQRKREEDFVDILNFGVSSSVDTINHGEFVKFVCNVEVSNKRLVLQDGEGDLNPLKDHLREELELLYKANTNQVDESERIKDLKVRLNRLDGNVAEIFVGAETDSKILEKIDRVDDGLKAVHSAYKHGIIPGGGLLLKNIMSDKYSKLKSCINDKILSNLGSEIKKESGYYPNIYDPAKSTELSLRTAYEITEIISKLKGVVLLSLD